MKYTKRYQWWFIYHIKIYNTSLNLWFVQMQIAYLMTNGQILQGDIEWMETYIYMHHAILIQTPHDKWICVLIYHHVFSPYTGTVQCMWYPYFAGTNIIYASLCLLLNGSVLMSRGPWWMQQGFYKEPLLLEKFQLCIIPETFMKWIRN